MRVRWASWAAFGLICLLLIVALGLGVSFESPEVATAVFVLGNGAVGALVASRLPRHPVGWLLLGASACFAFGGLVITYVEQADSRSFPLTPIVVLMEDLQGVMRDTLAPASVGVWLSASPSRGELGRGLSQVVWR